jgi:hypothetical protein
LAPDEARERLTTDVIAAVASAEFMEIVTEAQQIDPLSAGPLRTC